MNSYLGHLVHRSLDHGNRVRPRVPSLFEPASEGGGLSSAAMAAMTDRPQTDSGLALTQAIAHTPGESSQTPAGSTPSPALRPLPLSPGSNSQVPQRSVLHPAQRGDAGETTTFSSPVADQVSNTAAPSPRPVSSPSVSPQRIDAQGDGQPAAFPEMPSTQTQPVVPASSPPSPPIIIERRIETMTPAMPVPNPTVSPASKTISHIENPSSPEVIKRHQPFPHLTPTSTENPTHLRPAMTTSSPLPELSATQPMAPPWPAPAPTIQVTIGRIEVRATTTAPKQRKSRPAPSTLSLNDYLQQRGGGK
ncbi:MAG: hypothetical protein AAGD09_12635 [Cyanobacteria bacterium P01_F01_bin.56]